MSLSIVLDVAIGLGFTFAILSVIASALKEYIAGMFAWRGTYLSKGIDVILDNRSDVAFAWGGVGAFLAAHFTPAPAPPPTAATMTSTAVAPVGPAATQALQQVLDVKTHPMMRSTPSTLPSYVSSRNFALAMLEVLRDGSSAPLFSQVQQTIAKLPNGDLKQTLTLFVQDAGGDLDAFRAHLEHWFDDAMDRLSGIYKRLSQYVLLILGLVFAVALNVDSIRLANTLWSEPALRSGLATAAANYQPPAPVSGQDQQDPTHAALETMHHAYTTLYAQHLPIGWTMPNCPPKPHARPAGCVKNISRSRVREVFADAGWLSHLVGWLLTAFAISLGAPFWFDLVNKFTNLRASGPTPATADERAAAKA
jgi:hypothetical protein